LDSENTAVANAIALTNNILLVFMIIRSQEAYGGLIQWLILSGNVASHVTPPNGGILNGADYGLFYADLL
jgi:hypothetical protein